MLDQVWGKNQDCEANKSLQAASGHSASLSVCTTSPHNHLSFRTITVPGLGPNTSQAIMQMEVLTLTLDLLLWNPDAATAADYY